MLNVGDEVIYQDEVRKVQSRLIKNVSELYKLDGIPGWLERSDFTAFDDIPDADAEKEFDDRSFPTVIDPPLPDDETDDDGEEYD